jgi:membrane-associated phospholipid phosphatase
MDGSILWSTDLVHAIQELGSWLYAPMRVITFFGDEAWFLVFVSLVYWCLNKSLGIDLGVLLVAAAAGNTFIKGLFKAPRPLWLDQTLGNDPIDSFSLPSGHAQTGTVLYGALAAYASRRPWPSLRRVLASAGLILFILLVSLSRVILGVHFPGDVLLGMLAGLVTLIIVLWLRPRVKPWLASRTLRQHILMAVLVAALVMSANFLGLSVPAADNSAYLTLYAAGVLASMEDAATLAGMILGLWIGLALEATYVRFSATGPLWQRGLRYLGGLTGIVALWLGLRYVLPVEPLALGLALRVLRYGLTIFWAIYLWPALFVRMGLGARAVDSPVQA